MKIISRNPATEEVIQEFTALSESELEDRVQLARQAFEKWRRTPMKQRSELMFKAGEVLEKQKEAYARLMSLEMGKPIKASRAEIEKCAWVCRYYAEHAEKFLANEGVRTEASKSYVRYQPLGVILAIMPWNFPFWQVFRFAAPGLMAGNVGLLKHASSVPMCAMAIEAVFREAGFPKGIFQTLLITAAQAQKLIADSRIAGVTLTGSDEAGSKVAEVAGRHIKKTVLELGGSDPFIVMPSADLQQAAVVGVQARCINNGQSCIAAKRFIVHEDIADAYLERYIQRMRELVVGDPLDERTELGPLATEEILNRLSDQVAKSVAAGARVLLGGYRREGRGYYFEPTVLVEVPREAPAYREELFGPVAVFFRAKDLDHAIQIANDSPYGLGASVWTNDEKEIQRFIEEIETGMVFVNRLVVSDPRLPFSGVKRSGYGRELGVHGIREFVNIKTVVIA